MNVLEFLRGRRGSEDGVAMITTLLVGALLTAVAMALVEISVNNLRNAGRDRVATGALGAAEAGVAQAVSYLRSGVGELHKCQPSPGVNTCTAGTFGATDGRTLTFPDGGDATVSVRVVQAYKPPTYKIGTYVIRSVGKAGAGPGRRTVEQTVQVTPFLLPMGVYADNMLLNGSPQTFHQSVFSKDCIEGREKMAFSGIDFYYGIPSAAHSAKWIVEGNAACTETGSIHTFVPKKGSPTQQVCPTKVAYWDDQDLRGGNLSATGCYSASNPERTSSYFDANLLAQYGTTVPRKMLAALKAKAQSLGTYYTTPAFGTLPDPAAVPDLVLYFNVKAGDVVTLQSELDGWETDAETCTPLRSVIVVVERGDLHLNSNANLAGALLVPDGTYQYNGGATFTGPINAHVIEKWNGTATSQLTECYLANLPGPLLDVSLTRFREVDR